MLTGSIFFDIQRSDISLCSCFTGLRQGDVINRGFCIVFTELWIKILYADLRSQYTNTTLKKSYLLSLLRISEVLSLVSDIKLTIIFLLQPSLNLNYMV